MNKKSIVIASLSFFMTLALFHSAGAVMLRMPVETLSERASAVVRGFVLDAQAAPAAQPGNIETRVAVQVLERLKGNAPDSLEIAVPGGAVGGKFHFISDIPDFERGQEVILYLDETQTRIVGQIQGKMTIEDGLVKETMMDAELYLENLRGVIRGQTPEVDLDKGFHPISSVEGYIRRMNVAYGYDGLHWDTHNVGVSINENSSDTTGEGAAIQAGMYTWSHAGANFQFSYTGSNSRTQVSQNYENEAFWGHDGSVPDAIAYTAIWGYDNSTIAECDLLFQNTYNWSAQGNPGNNEMDVQNISTHELGHFLSLLDLYGPGDASKTMYGYAGPGETYKRDLTQDDKDGIIHIYGGGTPDDDADDDVTDDDAADDDWHDDDAADDAGDDSDGYCSDLLDLLYNQCGYKIQDGDQIMSGDEAYSLCQNGGDVWDCMYDCSQNEHVEDCSTFSSCLRALCNVYTKHGSSSHSSNGGGDGSSCGF